MELGEGTSVNGTYPEFQLSMLAHVKHSCFFPAADPPSMCKQPFELPLPVFPGHLVSNFLSTSLQLKVYSRSHSGYFIWNPCHRNLRGTLSLAVWVILKRWIILSNSSTAKPNSAFFLSLENASQTKDQFQ